MTEEEAIGWAAGRYDSDAMARLEKLAGLVMAEATKQNLVAPSTLASMWSRHLVDSLQLQTFVTSHDGMWVDVGTGAGFPGLAIACVRPSPMVLIEPRRRRAEFLEQAAGELSLDHVRVIAAKVEAVDIGIADIISARAVASISTLIVLTAKMRTPTTTYVLPRGQGGLQEVEALRDRSAAMFHVEHSLTDPRSIIVVASGVTGECTV